MSDYFDNWIVQVRKGLLDFYILESLAGKERYGYELVKALSDQAGMGVTEGTLYPLLSRLRMQGLVNTRLEESPEGPARKYYSLAPEGRRVLQQMRDYMETLAANKPITRKGGAS